MSHTNSTVNYGLPQFITTDKPAWLTDINNAFSAIDSGINNAQDKADTAYNDATAAQGDATTAISNASAADSKASGALASIEATFDPTTIYSVGAKVIYNSLLYVCTVAVTTPGPWTGATNWTRTTVDALIPATSADLLYESGSNVTTKAVIDSKANTSDVADMPKVFANTIVIGTVTAGTRYDLFNLSTFTGGRVTSFSDLKGLMFIGGGGQTLSYGYLFCGPGDNIIRYIPSVSDTGVMIKIAVLY